MIVSDSALRQWVTQLPARETVVEDLTMLGLEVDLVSPVAGTFNNVVVGEVVSCEQHPNADKLRITKVNVGEPELLDIVCGAKNCRQGLKVAVAKVGAILPSNFKIKPAKLRGQPSNGMLCSYTELGINIESDGIIELDTNAPIGTDIRTYLDLDDQIIDISLTANRADCLSQLGVARDLAAKYQLATNFAEFKASLSRAPLTTITETFPVEIKNTQACPAYASRVINGVDVNATTPDWMIQYLARLGIRSIDPIVDITNYVLHKLGYPMHAFDKQLLTNKIVVRDAVQGEALTLLSDETIAVASNTLVIADEVQAIALAGIFGGKDKSIHDHTTDIVLEAAFFDPLAIVNRARQYGLHTDSSHRFERGVDPEMLTVALDYCTQLILDIAGGQAGPINLVGTIPDNTKQVVMTHQLLERIAGISYTPEQVTTILTNLGCQVTTSGSDANDLVYTVVSPSWRFDLAIPEDIAEEVIRVFGYNAIPVEAPQAHLTMSLHQEVNLPLNRIKDILVNRDFQEIVSYSFVDPKLQQHFHKNEEALNLPNPISQEMSQMRLSLFTSLLTTLSYNLKRQQKRVRIFETGLIFVPDDQAEMGIRQEQMISGLITGDRDTSNWSVTTTSVDFFDAKGIVEDILSITNYYQAEQVSFKATQVTGFHPGQTAAIYVETKRVGIVGKVHPGVHKAFGVSGNIFMFSLTADAVSKTHIPEVKSVSKYQTNKRDIALIVAKDVAVGDVITTAKQAGNKELVQAVKLFDMFTGESIGAENKSIALTLTIGATDRTLEEAEITAQVNQIVQALATSYNAQLREV